MTSRDVIGLPPVTISLVTLYNCFLTVEDYTKDTQKFSCGKLPYSRRERTQSRMFVIYSFRPSVVLYSQLFRNMTVYSYITITSTFTNRFSRFKDQCEGENYSYSFSRAKFLKIDLKIFWDQLEFVFLISVFIFEFH